MSIVDTVFYRSRNKFRKCLWFQNFFDVQFTLLRLYKAWQKKDLEACLEVLYLDIWKYSIDYKEHWKKFSYHLHLRQILVNNRDRKTYLL